MSEMILASLSKIWHLVPIVIAIILFKKFINNKDNRTKINKHEENEKEGLTLELRAVKKYESLGFKVIYSETNDDKKESDIDLICTKDDKTVLIKCNNSSKSKSISAEDIETFYTNANNYVKNNEIEKNSVSYRYVILYRDVLDKSAIRILSDDSYNCKYMVL